MLGLASGAKGTVRLRVGESRQSRSYQIWAPFRRDPVRLRRALVLYCSMVLTILWILYRMSYHIYAIDTCSSSTLNLVYSEFSVLLVELLLYQARLRRLSHTISAYVAEKPAAKSESAALSTRLVRELRLVLPVAFRAKCRRSPRFRCAFR